MLIFIKAKFSLQVTHKKETKEWLKLHAFYHFFNSYFRTSDFIKEFSARNTLNVVQPNKKGTPLKLWLVYLDQWAG